MQNEFASQLRRTRREADVIALQEALADDDSPTVDVDVEALYDRIG